MAIHSGRYTSIFASTIALLTLLPNLALAETKPATHPMQPTQSAVAQTHSSIIGQLNLSTDQKNKIRPIRASRIHQINQVLTQEQRTKLQTELKSGMKLGEALKSLNLNADQKKKIMTIVQKSNQDVMSVLNQKQRTQLEAYLKQQHQSRTQTPLE
ncbi:MAG: hypothetical protein KME16_05380 [Scytolyngbya sp. HA4215-MV1]|jgi:Spy/CpxP family protein refolding chaperone|nr:hypothetical protein [Scytolyngbya sp. HA4215-MV1]